MTFLRQPPVDGPDYPSVGFRGSSRARRISNREGDDMSTRKPELPILPFASRNAWEAWLEEHDATSEGLWL
jgi:hypothetical protein